MTTYSLPLHNLYSPFYGNYVALLVANARGYPIVLNSSLSLNTVLWPGLRSDNHWTRSTTWTMSKVEHLSSLLDVLYEKEYLEWFNRFLLEKTNFNVFLKQPTFLLFISFTIDN